jgi:hypothetical protein
VIALQQHFRLPNCSANVTIDVAADKIVVQLPEVKLERL